MKKLLVAVLMAAIMITALATPVSVLAASSAVNIQIQSPTSEVVLNPEGTQVFTVYATTGSGKNIQAASGVTINWSTTAGGGSMSQTSNKTDSNGVVRSILTAGSLNGEFTVTANGPNNSVKGSYVVGYKTIHVKPSTLTMQNGLNVNYWDFIINQVNLGSLPPFITVIWDGGISETVYLNTQNSQNKVGHYPTTLHSGHLATDATAIIYSSWSGQFNLSSIATGITSTVVTSLSSSSIFIGSAITDLATVTGSGSAKPTGTVDFQVSSDNGATFTKYGATKTLDATGKATSDAYTPAAVGNYLFRAVYSGDSNYTGSQSKDTDEPLTVNRLSSTTITQMSASSIFTGGSVTDTATVTGTGPMPTGTVDFQVSSDNGVTFIKYGATKTLDNTGKATSDAYTPAAAIKYLFRAIYSGDTNYSGSQSPDQDEPLTVDKLGSSITTALSFSKWVLGQSGPSPEFVTDTATLTISGSGPAPGGTIDFQVKVPGGAFVTFDTKTVTGTGTYSSNGYKPLVVGTFYFRAVYSGDTSYTGSLSGDTEEPLQVNDIQLQFIKATYNQGTLPQQVITESTSWPVPTNTAYTNVTLSDVPAGAYDITNAVYNGWCADYYSDMYPTIKYKANVYSSLADLSTAPAAIKNISWNKINYILNTYTASNKNTAADIQIAMWSIIYGFNTAPAAYFTQFGYYHITFDSSDHTLVQTIITDANNHAGYVPVVGNSFAVILGSAGELK